MKYILGLIIGALATVIVTSDLQSRQLAMFYTNHINNIQRSYFLGCREAGQSVSHCKPKSEAVVDSFKVE